MTTPTQNEGLWTAWLIDEDGFAYDSADQALADHTPRTEFQILIVRHGAAPKHVGKGKRRFQRIGRDNEDNTIEILDEERPLYGGYRGRLSAAAIFERAVAMAAGLNLAGI